MSPTKTVKTGVTIPKEILDLIDEYMARYDVKSRSRLLSEAVKSFILDRSWADEYSYVIGVVVVVYNEKRGDTVKKLLDLQHEFLNEVISTMHFHASHDKCLEVILSRGPSRRIIELITRMENIVGVEMVRFIPVELRETR